MASPSKKIGPNSVFNGLVADCESLTQDAYGVMLKENDQMKAEMDRYENMICASQATHSLTASTVGIMVEGSAVRDLLPRAPARMSKKINIGDTILAVDGIVANAQNVLTLLRGSDQVGSVCNLDVQKKDGSRVQVALKRASTQKVFDVKVIFDNFAKILKLCVANGQQEIADLVLDTRMVWEMTLHADQEHEDILQSNIQANLKQHEAISAELMKKLDMLYNGYNSDYQMYLNDRQAWLEREAEYLRGGSSVKPAAPAAPAAPPAPVDGMVINSNVALKPKPTVPRDTKTNVVTVDMDKELHKKAPKDGWGIEYLEDAICVSLLITETNSFKEPEIPALVEKDVAAAANLSEDKVKVVCIDTPHEATLDLKPRIYNVKISGGQVSGYETVKDLAMQSRDGNSALRTGVATKFIKPSGTASIPLPPSELEKLQSGPEMDSDMVISYAQAQDIKTRAKPVTYPGKKSVQDQYAAYFFKTAGEEAFNIVSEMTARHVPRDMRIGGDETYVDVIEEKWDPYGHPSRDMYGEKMVGKLAGLLKSKGLKFTDPTFPPHLISLFADPATAGANANAEQTFRKDQDPFLAGVTGIEWKRPEELGDTTFTCKMFSGGIDPDDVAQGRLGNCYFLAAIANCATSNKDLIINDLVVEDYAEQGIYGVKFFINGKWVTVVVDDLIPCIPWGSQWMPIFAGFKDHSLQEKNTKELWPLIFEKAWAKLHLSYEATAGGDTADATNYLTGGVVTKLQIDADNMQATWDALYKMVNPENKDHLSFCSCNTRMDADPATLANTGLISGHAYSILAMKISQINGEKFIQVRNPWGNTEWNGDWSDKSPKWTEDLKVEIGHEDEVDGTFWMCWSDFATWFGDVQVTDPTGLALFTEGNTAQVDVFHAALVARKTAGGPKSASTFKYNPSCELTVDKDSKVELTLYQADVRSYGTDANGMMLDGQQLSVTLTDPSGHVAQVIDVSPYERFRCTEIFCVANKAYKVTVSSWAAGVECPFWLGASGHGLKLAPCPLYEPTAEDAEKMARKANQSFSCICCNQPFAGGSYYPCPDGPTCVPCKTNAGIKCSRCKTNITGTYYQMGNDNVCQHCLNAPKGFNAFLN